MGFEVELKVHVKDPEQLRKEIEKFSLVNGPVFEIKEDIYYALPGEDALFRLRRESSGPSFADLTGQLIFTRKHKALKDGIEVNQELEFSANYNQFEQAHAFFLSLGYGVFIRKTKKGYSYSYRMTNDLPFLHLELVEVPPLGWFLEMEFVLEDEKKVPMARTLLIQMLEKLGIDQSDIESRYYMHLLKAQTIG